MLFEHRQFVQFDVSTVARFMPDLLEELESFRVLRYKFVAQFLGAIVSRKNKDQSFGQCSCELYGWFSSPTKESSEVTWKVNQLDLRLSVLFHRGDLVIIPFDDLVSFDKVSPEESKIVVHVL